MGAPAAPAAPAARVPAGGFRYQRSIAPPRIAPVEFPGFDGGPEFPEFNTPGYSRQPQSLQEVLDVILRAGHSRIPVYRGDRDTIVYRKPDFRPATYTILNFPVDDIARAYDDLTKRGVRFGYQNDEDLGTDDKGIYWGLDRGEGPNIAWFRDPAGNSIEIAEPRIWGLPEVG